MAAIVLRVNSECPVASGRANHIKANDMKPFLFRRGLISMIVIVLSMALYPTGFAVANAPDANLPGRGIVSNNEMDAQKVHSAADQQLNGSGKPRDLVRKHHYRANKSSHTAHRKGIAVIADFTDSRLEEWQGDGINSVDKLAVQLRKMEEHWLWLSRGQESFKWDIVRVTLPVALGPNAYSGWGDYRDAVAALIRQQVDVAQYDANGDGVLDTAWIVASNKGMNFDYLIGGSSLNAGVNIFVDPQNSGSVVAGATGNFNHEVAHTLGIPDIYGAYDTLHYLTMMSDSWALPPQDFTAYERMLLDWVKPRVIDQGIHRVHLSSPDSRMEAVRIPTSRASEYFLIEYRRHPANGFGSLAPPYNGLAVYHVLEGSSQWDDPPLLKLEAADGYISPDSAPEVTDFLFPGNPGMQQAFVLRSYFGGQEVFRLGDLQWADDGGLLFDVQVAPATSGQATNLLSNPSFEAGVDSSPSAWQPSAFDPTAQFSWEAGSAKEGRRRVGIAASIPNDAAWAQSISGLNPGQAYGFCGWIRGKDIAVGGDAQIGANLSILGGFVRSESLSGTFDWQQTCVTFRPQETSATLACRLGFYGSTVTGMSWCDDMTLVPLKSAFE